MEKGKVALLRKPLENFEINEHEVPEPGDDTILLSVELTGICGTDVHIYEGKHHGIDFPLVLGHEIVGTVKEKGKNVDTDVRGNRIEVGDRLAMTPAMTCGQCYYCAVAKTPVRCLNSEQFGFYSGNRAGSPFNGGYGQYLVIDSRKAKVFKTFLDPEEAVFAEPLAVAIHTVRRAGIIQGDTVVVQGGGALGLIHIVAAKAAGASRVILVTNRNTEKLAVAGQLGADEVITLQDVKDRKERVERIRKLSLSGYGADSVFECVGLPSVIDEGLEYLRDSGSYCIVGHAVFEGTVSINPTDIMERNLRIEGIFDHTVEQLFGSIALLETRLYPVGLMLTHKVDFGEIAMVMKRVLAKEKYKGREVIKAALKPW